MVIFKKNNQKGITLIALVITIIVLLILAGISLSLVLGENGVLKRAAEATKRNTQATAQEQIQLEVAGSYDISEFRLNESKLKSNLENIGAQVDGNEFPFTVEFKGYSFIVDNKGTVYLSDKTVAVEIPKVSDTNPGIIEGAGTVSDPYKINSVEDLVAFAYNVNHNDDVYSGKTVELGLNLDIQNDNSYINPEAKYVLSDYGYTLSNTGTGIKQLLTDTEGIGFVPIGNGKSVGFAGTFDGNNHYIANLYEKSSSHAGLFGKTGYPITIKNVGLLQCNITSTSSKAAGIVAETTSLVTIDCCYTTGSVSARNETGGIIGLSKPAKITNCYNTATITSQNDNAAGMLAECSSGDMFVVNCYNGGAVTGSSRNSWNCWWSL